MPPFVARRPGGPGPRAPQPPAGAASLIPLGCKRAAIKLNSCLLLRRGFRSIALGSPAIIEETCRVMSKREKEASNTFRPSDRPLTEYEKEQIALRKNLERLKAERLAREKAKSKDD